jgi:F-box-like
MSKHGLSDPSLPPAKRLCASSGSAVPVDPRRLLTFDNSIYDELVLCIFSHLSWVDLCAVQVTSRNWARLAADNELWRKQFLSTFGRPRLRGSRGFVARTDGKEVKPLPGRARNEEHKDWKWMFRISANWKTGTSIKLNLWRRASNHPAFRSVSRRRGSSASHTTLRRYWT